MGIGLEFKFSPEWTGLNKTACFTADGKNLPSVRIPESGKITIPSEAFNQNNIMLNVGVYGETKDGKIVIPTIYCFLGNVRQGAQKCGRPPQPPTPDWTAGIEQDVADALTAARAVERRANAGEFNGEPGKSPKIGENTNWFVWDDVSAAWVDTGVYSGGQAPYIGANGHWFVGTNDTGVNATGARGKDGYTPVKGIDYFDGEPGKPGPPGATGDLYYPEMRINSEGDLIVTGVSATSSIDFRINNKNLEVIING